ncbi:MAG: hypothetical protein IKN79_02320 [Eubacterium sp.]|nr:hypothetical protein [Eubacterium sp.]
MGYGLPAAVGAAVAERTQGERSCNTISAETEIIDGSNCGNERETSSSGKLKPCVQQKPEMSVGQDKEHPYVVCLEGDGSIMMNLQELQTIATNHLPVKIFLINNEGYHSIRQTQTNLFGNHTKVGIGPESGDLSFPDFGKLAEAFGIRYMKIEGNRELERKINKILSVDGITKETGDAEAGCCPLLCEIIVTTQQNFEPKSSTRRNPDGTLESPPLEDLAPFLPREELADNMFI